MSSLSKEPLVPAESAEERKVRELASKAPQPARVGPVLLGTAGWTDPSLISSGLFYPRSAKTAAQRLSYYTTHFPMVEVDSTYYAIPSASVSEGWVEHSPPSFIFDIKAHPVLTGHPLERNRLPKDIAEAARQVRPERNRLYPQDLPEELRKELVDRFRLFVEPLANAGRLGCVMVQLPPWTTATRGAVRMLESLAEQLPGVRMAVEFRHPSWLVPERQQRVFDLLTRQQLAYVVVDEPQVEGGGVPPVIRATRRDLAVVRFHGQNVAGWHRGASVGERFNYLYSPEELGAWTDSVRQLTQQAESVHAVFNNCVRDFAVLNAKNLAALLLPGLEKVLMHSEQGPGLGPWDEPPPSTLKSRTSLG